MAAASVRRIVRRLAEPRAGAIRRIPLGPARGIRLEGDPSLSLDLWFGLFESELAPTLERYCTPGRACVDVGSYNAYYALTFAKLTGSRVRAYDAAPPAVELIRRSLALNPELAPLVEVRSVQVGQEHDPQAARVTLDADLAGWGRVHVLKVDVEGAELEVLRGAEGILSEQRPHVVVETHSGELESACAELLAGHGYRPRVIGPRRWLAQNRPSAHNRWLAADGA